MTSLTAAWGRTFTVQNLNYEVMSESERTVRVLGHTTSSGTIYRLVIPGTVNDRSGTVYTVSEVGKGAFRGRTISSMTIERGPGVLYFAEEAMADAEVTGLTVSRSFDNPVNQRPFHRMSTLTSVTFGEGIVYIPNFAFVRCPLKSTLVFPTTLATIGFGAFEETGISGVRFASTKNLIHIEGEAFCGCRNLTSIVIPEGVTWIGETCFAGTGLVSISLPSTLYQIDKRAFATCNNLKNVTLSPTNTYFEYNDGVLKSGTNVVTAFDVSNSLTVPEGVWGINGWAFAGMKIQELRLPSTLKVIGEFGINDCEDLKSINLPEGLVSIGRGGLIGCRSLEELKLPESLTTIGPLAFSALGAASINIPAGLKEIPERTFEVSDLKSIDIPETVEKIGPKAFFRSTKLETVTFGDTPGTVTDIPMQAFCDCQSLRNIKLPAYLRTIGDEAFSGCFALTSILLPGELREIGEKAFEHANDLRDISIKAGYPPTVPLNAFSNAVYRYGKLTVPVGSAKLYKEAPVWQLFSTIVESAELGGVDDITADTPDGPVRVYRLDGVKVYDGPRDGMPALTPGLYLVNGRKVQL